MGSRQRLPSPLFSFHHTNMTLTIIALIILLGLLFMLLEVLVIPGTTFVGIIGIILVIIGNYFAFVEHGNLVGFYFLGGTAIISFITIYFSLKSNTWKKATLSSEITGKTNLIDVEKLKVGDTGKAISRLTPMGKALINEIYVEVECRDGYVTENSDIVVVKIAGNKIYVKPKP